MIVRPANGDIHLITQPDHAHLARAIMGQCAPLANQARRDAILHAIGEHDNGWAEEDRAPLLDPRTGGIADFVGVPVPVRQAVWPRGVARLAHDSWAAALVAHHAVTVYDWFRSDPEWRGFFVEMEAARDAKLRAHGMALDDLLADYAFVRLGDLISLAFCTGATAAQRFGGWTIQLSGSRVAVTPEAFGGATIPIEIGARQIRSQSFRSDADVRRAFREAEMITLRGEVGGNTAGR